MNPEESTIAILMNAKLITLKFETRIVNIQIKLKLIDILFYRLFGIVCDV